ncbi:MAG: hypothetical protein R3310_13115 [Candidatus Competibacteraceae bacterium]|nr:hypothetical protein [Candidatus Competibacteraceae bacterium]
MPAKLLRALALAILVTAAPLPAAEPQVSDLVAERLAETRQLLTTLDRLIQDLEAFAQRQLELAELSQDFHQAARYEALYGETLLRVEQLQAQRRQLRAALQALEERAGELDRAQP